MKDADGANLDRIQIVKGWVDAKGEPRDAVRNKLALLEDVPATLQERAWTSPIW